MPPKRQRRFQGLYFHSSPPKVISMNGQMSNENLQKRKEHDDFSVKLSTIRIWMHEKEIGKLTRLLWAGQGNRLRQQASTNPRVKRFLASVPHVMNVIKDVHQAVVDNNLENLQGKLEPPVPPALITCRDANGLNLVHKAAGLGHTKILEYLIESWPEGAHEADITGKTPLHWAASAKNNMRCYTLLTQAGCDEEILDYKGKSPSYYRHKPNEIERAFLLYVPDAPRVPHDVDPDWEALSEDCGDGKKLDIKIPENNGSNRAANEIANETSSEVEGHDGDGDEGVKETPTEAALKENGSAAAPLKPETAGSPTNVGETVQAEEATLAGNLADETANAAQNQLENEAKNISKTLIDSTGEVAESGENVEQPNDEVGKKSEESNEEPNEPEKETNLDQSEGTKMDCAAQEQEGRKLTGKSHKYEENVDVERSEKNVKGKAEDESKVKETVPKKEDKVSAQAKWCKDENIDKSKAIQNLNISNEESVTHDNPQKKKKQRADESEIIKQNVGKENMNDGKSVPLENQAPKLSDLETKISIHQGKENDKLDQVIITVEKKQKSSNDIERKTLENGNQNSKTDGGDAKPVNNEDEAEIEDKNLGNKGEEEGEKNQRDEDDKYQGPLVVEKIEEIAEKAKGVLTKIGDFVQSEIKTTEKSADLIEERMAKPVVQEGGGSKNGSEQIENLQHKDVSEKQDEPEHQEKEKFVENAVDKIVELVKNDGEHLEEHAKVHAMEKEDAKGSEKVANQHSKTPIGSAKKNRTERVEPQRTLEAAMLAKTAENKHVETEVNMKENVKKEKEVEMNAKNIAKQLELKKEELKDQKNHKENEDDTKGNVKIEKKLVPKKAESAKVAKDKVKFQKDAPKSQSADNNLSRRIHVATPYTGSSKSRRNTKSDESDEDEENLAIADNGDLLNEPEADLELIEDGIIDDDGSGDDGANEWSTDGDDDDDENAGDDDDHDTATPETLAPIGVTREDENNNGTSPTSSMDIEGFVQGEAEDNTVQSESTANVDELKELTIEEIIEAGNMEELAQIVLNGDGKKLLDKKSQEPEIQAFLNNVPNYMEKIQRVHEAARSGSLLSLQQALDRRKFAVARDEISPNGTTPLHVGVLFGHSDIVRYLAARFPETMEQTDNDGRTALHYAATIKDNGHFYNVLIQLGANPKAADTLGHTAEFYLESEQAQDILTYRQLLNYFGAEHLEDELLSDQDKGEKNCFHTNPIFKTEPGKYLATNLADPLIKALNEIASKRPEDPVAFLANYLQSYARSRHAKSGGRTAGSGNKGNARALVTPNSPLQRKPQMNGNVIAVHEDINKIVEEPVAVGEDESFTPPLEDRDEHGQSMLHFACARAHRRGGLLHIIEESKVDISYRDELYRTARDVSLQANQPANAKEIDRFVLSMTAVGDVRPFEHLALAGYDHILDVVDENGKSIMDVASERQHKVLANFFRDLRALEETREELHQMIRDNNVERIKEITASTNAKWLIKAKNYYGRTALHIAILKESEELVEHFVQVCPEALKIGDNLERTAMHYAMGTNTIESVSRILIQNGAKRTIKDLKGRQPTYYFMNKADILRLQEEEDENR